MKTDDVKQKIVNKFEKPILEVIEEFNKLCNACIGINITTNSGRVIKRKDTSSQRASAYSTRLTPTRVQ